MNPKVLAVATAVPPYALSQGEIKEYVASMFRTDFNQIDHYLPVFDNSSIQTRYLAQPLEWYARSHTFAEANTIFQRCALELAEAAAWEAISRSGVGLTDIGMVIYISSTGIATPTLDARLIQNLGLSCHTKRLPVWGLGCAGGVAGLARAAEVAAGLGGRAVLVVAVELCSLTFQRNDLSKANLVGTSIFGDGAAAVVIGSNGQGPEILGAYSTIFPDTEDIMGWELVDTGLKVRFSRDIPRLIRTHIPEVMREAFHQWQILPEEICHYVVHPGGARVLRAYQDSLGISEEQLQSAYHVLRDYGNMSSVSVLFVLQKFLAEVLPLGSYGAMLALGPGFCAEQVLFKW